MKRLNILAGVIAGIAGILIAAGCANHLLPAPPQETSGQGNVTIHIGDTNSHTSLSPDGIQPL
jgi:hypothetical protein